MGASSVYILLSFAVVLVLSQQRFPSLRHHYIFADTIERERRGQMRPIDLLHAEDIKLEPLFSLVDIPESPTMVRQSRNQLHQLNRLLKKPVFNFANLFRRAY